MVDGAKNILLVKGKASNLKTKMKFMEFMKFTCFLSNVMAISRMLARHTLYLQLHYEGINDKLRYGTIKTVFEWANKKGTIMKGRLKNKEQYSMFWISSSRNRKYVKVISSTRHYMHSPNVQRKIWVITYSTSYTWLGWHMV